MTEFDEINEEMPGEDTEVAINTPEKTVDEDLELLKKEFSELSDLESITQLKNPTRYAALRDLGLSAQEAYLATSPRIPSQDSRAHLTSGVPISAKSPASSMTKSQMEEARELFRGMSDAQIHKLYQKVTK